MNEESKRGETYQHITHWTNDVDLACKWQVVIAERERIRQPTVKEMRDRWDVWWTMWTLKNEEEYDYDLVFYFYKWVVSNIVYIYISFRILITNLN